MTSVRLRFILTGSCFPYSGRQVFFVVPLDSPSSSPTTVGDVKTTYIRQRWPKELASVFEGREVVLKILKNGRLLSDSVLLREALTTAELETSSIKVGRAVSDGDQASLAESSTLMHLVFSVSAAEIVVEPRGSDAPPPVVKKAAVADSGCGCSVM
jgi:hypothetical protein